MFVPLTRVQQSIGRKCARDTRRELTDADWNLMASFLSPAKDPLHPCKKSNTHSRSCRFGLPELPHRAQSSVVSQSPIPSAPKCRCLCIACVGPSNAKPNTTPCLVCGGTILFSICQNKTSTSASPSSALVMCFNCKVFLIAFDS